MSNLFIDETPRDFFIWVNPLDFFAKWNIQTTGQFFSVLDINNPEKVNIAASTSENLMFMPNPNFNSMPSFFQINLLRPYFVEYDLEMGRRHYFPQYPSRLEAIFLLEDEDNAYEYQKSNLAHVGDRVLKKVKTVGQYRYSKHDSSWITFCRLPNGKDQETNDAVCRAYWSGMQITDAQLFSRGERWTAEPITEILYLGIVEFYDREFEN
jgi:hypothetical protein